MIKYGTALVLLLLATLGSVAMNFLRSSYSGQATFMYMDWNLFLAWVPLLVALGVYEIFSRKKKVNLFFFGGLFAWLIFYPNSPYVLTDFLHLKVRENIPLWYDLILISSYAIVSLFAGFLSMFLIHKTIERFYGKLIGWVGVGVGLFLSGIGVYLGRFLRLNSWDILFGPQEIVGDLISKSPNPFDHLRVLVFVSFFAGFSFFVYGFLYFFRNEV